MRMIVILPQIDPLRNSSIRIWGIRLWNLLRNLLRLHRISIKILLENSAARSIPDVISATLHTYVSFTYLRSPNKCTLWFSCPDCARYFRAFSLNVTQKWFRIPIGARARLPVHMVKVPILGCVNLSCSLLHGLCELG